MTYLTENPWPITTLAACHRGLLRLERDADSLQKKAWRVAQVCVGLGADSTGH